MLIFDTFWFFENRNIYIVLLVLNIILKML